jgi:hypothetical protein
MDNNKGGQKETMATKPIKLNIEQHEPAKIWEWNQMPIKG